MLRLYLIENMQHIFKTLAEISKRNYKRNKHIIKDIIRLYKHLSKLIVQKCKLMDKYNVLTNLTTGEWIWRMLGLFLKLLPICQLQYNISGNHIYLHSCRNAHAMHHSVFGTYSLSGGHYFYTLKARGVYCEDKKLKVILFSFQIPY